MDVWITEWSKPGESESNTTVWVSQDAALQAATHGIIQDLSYWDMDDEEQKDRALQIADAAAKGNYKEAIQLFNDWNSDLDYEYQEFYFVYDKPVLLCPPAVGSFTIASDDEDDDDSSEETVKVELSYECPCGLVRATCDYHKP